MRGLAVIVVLSVATLSSSSRVSVPELILSDLPDCPPEDPTLPPAYFPNPDDNTTFYVCSWGIPILQHCPAGLIWNTQLKTCDREESTISPVTPGDETTSTTSNPEPTSNPGSNPTGCPAVNGPEDVLLPNPQNCGTFFKCDNGVPILQYCPGDLEWNDEKKYCDYPENAHCTVTANLKE